MPTAFQFLIKIIQQNIGEQRRERTALRRSFCPLTFHPSLQQPRLQIPAYETKEARILHLAGHASHKHIVIHPVKEFLQIHVHHPTTPPAHIVASSKNRLMGASPRTESITEVRKPRLEQRRYHLMRGLLNQSIYHRRDA